MDGQVEYPGVQGNVGQTLSCPNEKGCEPSHATAERCSRKRVCHKLLLPGAVAGELSKPKTPSQQKRHDNYTPAFLAVVFKLQF